MKVNKITALVCLIITVLSGVLLIFSKDYSMLQNVLSGIFTGFIVSLVIAVIGYFHERAKILETIDINIRSLFLNIAVMSKMLEKLLPQIHNAASLQDLPFKNLSGFSALNLEFIEKMNLGLYSPFYSKSQKAMACKRLKEFHQTAYNIQTSANKLEMMVLRFCAATLTLQNNQMMGKQPTSVDLQNLDNKKNEIIIFTAKFHEYTTGQVIELKKIAQDFFGSKKNRFACKEKETGYLSAPDRIVREG